MRSLTRKGTSLSSIAEILEHNKKVRAEHYRLQELMDINLQSLKAPCGECPYDGVFRCEACAERFYEGFNTRDYP